MKEKLIKYLEYEEFLLKKLQGLTNKQQEVLIKYEIDTLEIITRMQEETSQKLRTAEDMRLDLLVKEFGFDEESARQSTVSSLLKYYSAEDSVKIDKLRNRIKELMNDINSTNVNNRVLTNRALAGTRKILEAINSPENQVISVKV